MQRCTAGPFAGAALGTPESGRSVLIACRRTPLGPSETGRKVLKGDYIIDMAKLLRDNMEAERRRPRAQHACGVG